MTTHPARRSTRALAVALATAAAVAVVPPAQAATTLVRDGGDVPSLTDIRAVRVTHTDRRVRVRVTFPDLRRRAEAGLTMFFDSDRDARGPERGIALPLFGGADFAMSRMRDWQFVGSNPVRCSYGADYRWGRDVLVLTARRGCFGRPDEIRVGMRMRDLADGSHPVTDWLIGRRRFTEWLPTGEPA